MSPSYSHDHLGSVWYHSEPSEALIPQTSNWSGTIFGHFLQQTGSNWKFRTQHLTFLDIKNPRSKEYLPSQWFILSETLSLGISCTYFMNSLSCEESPKITKLNNRNKISFLVLAERIDMIFSAPFDDFLVWTSGFFGRFKSCCIFNRTFSLFFCKVAKSIWGLNWFLRFKRVV